MADGLLGILTDDEDVLELMNNLNDIRRPKVFRNRENHFDKWNDMEFHQRFRFSKAGVRFILNLIERDIAPATNWNHALLVETKLLLTLRFYASGSFLQVISDFVGVDKSTASRVVHQVTRAIAGLHRQYIKMPESLDDMRKLSHEFYDIRHFPRCIGAVDCSHIKILSPGGNQSEIYRNRKGFFSYNVQAICDANLKILDIVCRWPGSSHDSTIFNNSRIRARFENNEFNNYMLVGDGGYAVKPYLLTPLRNPTTPAQELYNGAQIATRNPIERCFGVWKRRFPVLSLGIRLATEKIEAVVVATAVLHNIALLLREQDPILNDEEQEAINIGNNLENDIIDIPGGNDARRRDVLINEYFEQFL